MIIDFNGKAYSYDPTAIDVTTAIVIQEHSGWGLKTFSQKVDDWDPIAARLLFWAIKRQNGEPCDPDQLDFSVPDLMNAVEAALLVELEARVEREAKKQKATRRPKAQSPRARSPRSTSSPTQTSASSGPDTSFS